MKITKEFLLNPEDSLVSINARTKAEDKKMRQWYSDKGLHWARGQEAMEYEKWNTFKEKTGYSHHGWMMDHGGYHDVDHAKSFSESVMLTVPEFFEIIEGESEDSSTDEPKAVKRGRGRPKGSKNKPKVYNFKTREEFEDVIKEGMFILFTIGSDTNEGVIGRADDTGELTINWGHNTYYIIDDNETRNVKDIQILKQSKEEKPASEGLKVYNFDTKDEFDEVIKEGMKIKFDMLGKISILDDEGYMSEVFTDEDDDLYVKVGEGESDKWYIIHDRDAREIGNIRILEQPKKIEKSEPLTLEEFEEKYPVGTVIKCRARRAIRTVKVATDAEETYLTWDDGEQWYITNDRDIEDLGDIELISEAEESTTCTPAEFKPDWNATEYKKDDILVSKDEICVDGLRYSVIEANELRNKLSEAMEAHKSYFQ